MKKEIELYEIIYLINPGFTQQEITEKVDYYQTFLTQQGSQVMVQNRGNRSFPTAQDVRLVSTAPRLAAVARRQPGRRCLR